MPRLVQCADHRGEHPARAAIRIRLRPRQAPHVRLPASISTARMPRRNQGKNSHERCLMSHATTDQSATDAADSSIDSTRIDTDLPACDWDDFQIAAMDSINAGRSVLVSAPTGAGKTAIAEHAIRQALDAGSDAVYTTPIKALSNQKFRDFRAAYGDENVGLLTGDTTVPRDAPLVVMTTEVLRNMLHSEDSAGLLSDVTWVVLDEVHYLQDAERGGVWEEIIIHAPAHMRFVCLSATVSNAEQFGQWLRERRGRNFDVIVSEERPVPLTHWHLVRDEQSAEMRRVPLLTDAGTPNMDEGGFLDTAPRRIEETWNDDECQYDYDSGWRFSTPSTAAVIRQLRDDHHLPALFFIFSRDRCDKAVTALLRSGMDLVTEDERRRIREIAASEVLRLSHLIRGAEHRVGLQLTKATDMRYAAAASAWASGCTLSEALVSVPRYTLPLSGGDFARNMLILADVLRQLAHAAPAADLSQQAARVSALMLRGAVTASEETTRAA